MEESLKSQPDVTLAVQKETKITLLKFPLGFPLLDDTLSICLWDQACTIWGFSQELVKPCECA